MGEMAVGAKDHVMEVYLMMKKTLFYVTRMSYHAQQRKQ